MVPFDRWADDSFAGLMSGPGVTAGSVCGRALVAGRPRGDHAFWMFRYKSSRGLPSVLPSMADRWSAGGPVSFRIVRLLSILCDNFSRGVVKRAAPRHLTAHEQDK